MQFVDLPNIRLLYIGENMREKFVVVSYDIKDDAVRSDIALRLQYHGLKREQYSCIQDPT